ncbi:phytoene/squalene synthase family protein [Noviherbaspirillum sp. L7-7A]|uniref:phytoene/squalene synthase family protein n=1 Tax=Noviherbaspirillum sp. L7-7A TaxID=2850560 RepID=UPI001C2BDA50|nr:phytoene/squalene synthase family protein [Noviherbaspirillum sp. L7-7A]MBV0881696.1 phytoene/squalene synthase family protein [Noviherbaspirillum sp. L7-7A]
MEDISAYSQQSIRQGSKSFAKAAMLFDRDTRDSVMMLYAWCRHCDDVIDGQTLGHHAQELSRPEKEARLQALQRETARVCDGHSSEIPAFAALGRVVRRHDLPRRQLFELLEGFAMDAREQRFQTLDDTLLYCYHVAGVVGVMMARIMGVRDAQVMHRAADLGIAFQLTNIARDVRDDLRIGRCYLPEDWLARQAVAPAQAALPHHLPALHGLACELVELAEQYYASARIGMAQLPWRCAWAIASALLIYRDIGLRVRAEGTAVWEQRASVSGRRKLVRLFQGGFVAAHAMARRPVQPPRNGLWTHPDL